jgi:hypothetical protein
MTTGCSSQRAQPHDPPHQPLPGHLYLGVQRSPLRYTCRVTSVPADTLTVAVTSSCPAESTLYTSRSEPAPQHDYASWGVVRQVHSWCRRIK